MRSGGKYVLVVAVAAAAVLAAAAIALAARGRGRSQDPSSVAFAVELVDKMEWQVRSCQALGWLLGGTLAQLKGLEQQRVAMPAAALAARIDSAAIVLVLPNLQPAIRTQIADAHRVFLLSLWGSDPVSPLDASQLIMDVWDPACAVIRLRY